jgi:hypothetical protein
MVRHRPEMTWSRSSAGLRPCRAAASRVRGVQREQHGQTELAQLIQDGLEPLRIVGVLRAVDGGQDVFTWLGAQVGRDRARGHVVRGHIARDLDDRVVRVVATKQRHPMRALAVGLRSLDQHVANGQAPASGLHRWLTR